MSHLSGFREGVAEWVHPRARAQAAEFARHVDFIISRLAMSLALLVMAPAFLAFGGTPHLWEGLIFACAIMPLAGIFVLSRTGNFLAAQSMSIAVCLGASVILASGLGGLSAAALVWLAIVPLEALMAGSALLVLAAGAASIATLAGILYCTQAGLIPRDAGGGAWLNALCVVLAMSHVCFMALGVLRQLDRRRKRETSGDAQFNALEHAMGDLVLRHDSSGAVLYAGSESEILFGLMPQDFMGRGLFERILVQDRPAFLTAISRAANSIDTVSCEMRLRKASPANAVSDFSEPVFTWVELRARRIMDLRVSRRSSDDDGASVLSVLRDVSRAKAYEQELEAARRDAEQANAWKDRLIANVSHELRTPLNAIIGFSEILGNDQLMPTDPERRKEYADIVHSSGEHLLAVVNSILDVSKIEAGRFDILTEPFDLAPLLESCCDMMSLRAVQSGVSLTRDCAPEIGELVADKRACKQILLNLLSNALKFTPSGGRVRVSASIRGNLVAICVEDTGVGIAGPDLAHIGEAFFQAVGSHDREYEGTGLGLSVVRGLVGLHGGAMSVESGEGDGTSVTVLLPRDARDVSQKHRSAARIETIARIGSAAGRSDTRHTDALNPRMKQIA